MEKQENYILGGIITPSQPHIITTHDIKLVNNQRESVPIESVFEHPQLLMLHNMSQFPIKKINFVYQLRNNLF